MDDATLLNLWYLSLSIAGVIVVVAAILLLLVLQAARRIDRLADRTLEVVREIQQHTEAIWALQQTNQVAEQLREAAQQLEAHATEVVSALHEPEQAP